MDATRAATLRPAKAFARAGSQDFDVHRSVSTTHCVGRLREEQNGPPVVKGLCLRPISGEGLKGVAVSRKVAAPWMVNAVYRHSRLETVEDVFQGAESSRKAHTESDTHELPDLDTISQLYLERGCWDSEAEQNELHHAVSNISHSENLEEQTWRSTMYGASLDSWPQVSWNSSPQLADLPFRETQASGSAEQDSLEGIKGFASGDADVASPLDKVPRLIKNELLRGAQPSDVLGGASRFSGREGALEGRAARPWHETFEGRSADGGASVSVPLQESAKRNVPTFQAAQRTAEKKGGSENGATTQKTGEEGLREEGRRRRSQRSQVAEGRRWRSRAGSESSSTQLRPSEAQNNTERRGALPAEALNPSRPARAVPETEEGMDVQSSDEGGVESMQGLVFGRAGLVGLAGSALRWMQRLARALAATITKSLPSSVPKKSVEAVLYGVVALAGVWLCKAVLEVVLTTGAVLCCILIAARVLWASKERTASSNNDRRRDRSPSEEQDDWMGARNQDERHAPRKRSESKSKSQSVLDWALGQDLGPGMEGSRTKSRINLQKEPAIWKPMQAGFDEVFDRANTLMTAVRGSAASLDLLSMFDMSADSAGNGPSTYQKS
ncbi:hypothetical protein KFL_000690080 [Klebsormidium nitens]|uniref:Uncharacterized protein n=1 Tax=Klebsormidium nitens TaxID=105231 RepID=A0A1Y1HWZ2_KLENI|nr:hypothetical protein KFL_000690080 [Klebsormidium nitens]|eukprot:GAQ81026.1 hypothetical protein KFL_000690080 [Klebsormidium nitens]